MGAIYATSSLPSPPSVWTGSDSDRSGSSAGRSARIRPGEELEDLKFEFKLTEITESLKKC